MIRHARAALVTLALLALPLGVVAQSPPPPLTALLIEVEGAGHVFLSIDQDGRQVPVQQPASRADISTQPDGSVEILVVQIDVATRRVKAWTEAGQLLVLELSPEGIAHVERGQFYTVL